MKWKELGEVIDDVSSYTKTTKSGYKRRQYASDTYVLSFILEPATKMEKSSSKGECDGEDAAVVQEEVLVGSLER